MEYMGQLLEIKCAKCGEKNLYLDGRGYLPLESTAYEEIQKAPEYSELKTKVDKAEELYDCGYRIYYCKECKTLENHIAFKLRNLTSFKNRRKCSNCGKVMKAIKDESDILLKKIKINCQNCGEEDIAGTETVLGWWD